jgi:outer membrane lipoprotein-sorting protein
MDLALGKTSEMDGKPVWVIDATARKDAKNAPAAKARLYFDLETGALRKVQLMDPQEQTLSTMTYTNLTTNPTFPADRFTPPAAK